MGCLWKKTEIEQQSYLIMTELQDWGDMGEKMEVLGGDGTVPWLLQPTHAGSLILFFLKNLAGQDSLLWLY